MADKLSWRKWLPDLDLQLPRCLPDLYDYKTLLYIGVKIRWNYPTFRGQDKFDSVGYEITIIEKNPVTISRLKKINKEGHKFLNAYRPPGMFKQILEGDVRDIDSLVNGNKYDVVMFWQGPEHLYIEEIRPMLETLLEKTKKLLVLGCPCGYHAKPHPMAAMDKYKNSLSAHFSILSQDFFEELGYETDIVGIPGERGNNMLVWRRV